MTILTSIQSCQVVASDCFGSSWSLHFGLSFSCEHSVLSLIRFRMPGGWQSLHFGCQYFCEQRVSSAGHLWMLRELVKLVLSGYQSVGEHSALSGGLFGVLRELVTGLDLQQTRTNDHARHLRNRNQCSTRARSKAPNISPNTNVEHQILDNRILNACLPQPPLRTNSRLAVRSLAGWQPGWMMRLAG